MLDENFGRTIQLFLVDGTPTARRDATTHGWSGLTFVATGTALAALAARLEVGSTGIYILSGPDAEAVGRKRSYGRDTFDKPYSVSSPSATAAVMLDSSRNGLSVWKVKDEKRTYNDVTQARIAVNGGGL